MAVPHHSSIPFPAWQQPGPSVPVWEDQKGSVPHILRTQYSCWQGRSFFGLPYLYTPCVFFLWRVREDFKKSITPRIKIDWVQGRQYPHLWQYSFPICSPTFLQLFVFFGIQGCKGSAECSIFPDLFFTAHTRNDTGNLMTEDPAK